MEDNTKEINDEKNTKENKSNNPNNNKKDKNQMSEEDKELKKNIDEMVIGLFDNDPEIQINAFNLLKGQVVNSTSSMTSIPKPLKFLRLHYDSLKTLYCQKYENLNESNVFDNAKSLEFKYLLSDLLAVLVMVVSNSMDTVLHWVLKGNKKCLCDWGLEFIKSLSGNIGQEFLNRIENEKPYEDLYELVNVIIPYLISTHSESEAIDLLLEVEKLEMIMDFLNQTNYKRICLYLLASSKYAADSDENKCILEIAYNIYIKFKEYPNALRVAMKLNNPILIRQVFLGCNDQVIQYQLAFMLAKQRIWIEDNEVLSNLEIQTIISNLKLSDYFKRLAKDLDIIEPKHPEEVFKSHLEETKNSDAKLDSYKMNMAASIASSFINAGFGTECLLSKKDSDWFSRNKEEGVLNLLAGLGLINMWDIECGPNELEKYMGANETDPNKRAGYNIGLGIISSGVRDENNLAYAILTNQLNDNNTTVKISALFGLGLAYAGTQNKDLGDILLPILEDFSFGFEVASFVSLAYGLNYLGSLDENILYTMNESGNRKLIDNPYLVLYILGIGLTMFGTQKESDLMIETFSFNEFPLELRMFIKTLLTACAYAGSGNVTKVQEMQHLVAKGKEEVHPKVQSIAVIAISMIALGEDIGSEMVLRAFNHFLQYGDINVKKSVSLATSLLNLSNPKVNITDMIMKFCYDTNKEVSLNALFSLGLVCAGTNNSRISGQMRQLAAYHSQDTNPLMILRISQGLLHMGKGLMTLNPVYSHGFLLNNVALSGLLIAILSFTEVESLICGKYQFLIYSICLSMRPRMAMLVDEKLNPKNSQVMVGTAVDIVGQSGNPRTITGFQIQNAPVLLASDERCELSSEELVSVTDVLEDIVITRENPEYKRETKK